MQNLYKTTYQDALGIYREVYTIAEEKQTAIQLANKRITELDEQMESWYHNAVRNGMTARRRQSPKVMNTIFVMSAKEEVGA